MRREDTFPFWIMTLREYYIWLIDNNGEQTPELKRYKASLNPGDAGDGKCNSSFNSDWGQRYGNGCFHITNQIIGRRSYETYTVRILPPMGWLSLSDMFVSIPMNWDEYRNDISYRRYTHTDGKTYDIGPKYLFEQKIVFVKKDPLYAIPCNDMELYFILDNPQISGFTCESRFGIDPTEVGPNFFLNPEGQQKDRWIQERATCYKLKTNNQSYVAPGSRWGYWFNGLGSHTIQLYAAVNRVYLENVSFKNLKTGVETLYWNGGTKIADSDGTKGGCDFNAWSVVAYYNRDGKKNGNIIDESSDSTIEPGSLTYTSIFMANSARWNNWEGDGPTNSLYILHFDNTMKICCSPGAILGTAECGFGTNRISPGSTQCADLYRKTCKFDSPEFTTTYCLENGCRRNVKDSQSLIVCDYELKKFCNIIEDPSGPTAEKNKLLSKRVPYQAIVDDCNLYDEAFSGFTYTTDKFKMYDDKCRAGPSIVIDPVTGERKDVSSAISGYRTITKSIDPWTKSYSDYCSPGGKFYGAFQRWGSSSRNCESSRQVVDEFNKRISFYDKKLENIKRSNEIGRNVNQILYPDMCSCFASTKDLKRDCDVIADTMNIRNNKAAKKVLNIDTDDPLQCNQNCSVNPLCKASNVPSNQGYPVNRVGRPIQQGFIQDKGTCEGKNVCIQTATINNEGKIGKLTINQTANCSAYKSKFCQNSVLSKCDTQNGQGIFSKRVIEDKDGGTCSSNLESLQCAKINLTPVFDNGCVNGRRTIKYNVDNIVNSDDVIDALKTLLTPEMKGLNPIIEYIKETKEGIIYTDCQDCEMGYELKSDCYLEGGKWKTKATKTKVITQPLNKGKSCQIDNTVQITDCTLDRDCVVSINTQDSGCVSGKRSMTFNIDSYNSGNGKTCEVAVLEKVPQLFKDNTVFVDIQDNRKATASISCRDCIVDYKVDMNSNNGKCYFDGIKTVIKKVPFIKKPALNGGKCDININASITEECKFDQDCVFSDEPSKQGLCFSGEKTLEFDVKLPPSNKGKSCTEVAKTFGSRFTKDTSKNVFSNNKLYIKTTCEKVQDCEIENRPYQSGCDIKTGNAIELYKILTPQKNGGKTCSEVFNETIDANVNVSEDSVNVIVNKKCMGIETVKSSIKEDKRILYGIILFIILTLLILLASLL